MRWLVEACDRVGAHLVHVSTDYVFDGTLDRPYHEWDAVNPQSVYGASKLGGERRGTGARPGGHRGADVMGVRRARVEHGAHRSCDSPASGDGTPGSLAFVDDQRGHPTFTAELAPVLRRLACDRRGGVYHVTNQGAVSWYEFAREVVAALGRDPAIVRPIATSELQPPRPAPRPKNSVLENAALAAAGLPLLGDFRRPLAALVTALS